MAITRTPMVDDDGSGKTGTIINAAWKTEFYNQIDAADAAVAGAVGPVVAWTPVDASGAGLVFGAGTGGFYCLVGPTVQVWGRVILPATSNASPAKVGGLPFVNSGAAFSGFYPVLSPVAMMLYLPIGVSQISILTPAGAGITNVTLSAGQFMFAGIYLKG